MPIIPRDPNSSNNPPQIDAINKPVSASHRVRRRLDELGEAPPPPPPPPPAASAAEEPADPNRNPDGSYKVGRGKPPLHTRWQKGQSGNPQGPKKVKADLGEIVIDTMEQMIALTSAQGRRVRMTQGNALMRKLYEQAVKGNLKAAVFLLDLYGKALDRRSAGATSDNGLTDAEAEMLKKIFGQPAKDEGDDAEIEIADGGDDNGDDTDDDDDDADDPEFNPA